MMMRDNNARFGHDLNRLIFSKLSLADLYNLMFTNKQKQMEVNQYLTFVLSNAANFFTRLTDPHMIADLNNALMLLVLYHARLGITENPIKHQIENDGKFVTNLFDKYQHDGMSLSLIANAISRIANASKLQQLWKNKHLCDEYYSLVTSNIKEIPNLRDKVTSARSIPLRLALNLMVTGTVSKQRAWSQHDCFPVNLSGMAISSISRIGDLSCSVLKNMESGNQNNSKYIKNLSLKGADLSYDKECETEIQFINSSLRFAKIVGKPEVHYAFNECDLEFSISRDLNIRSDCFEGCILEPTNREGNNITIYLGLSEDQCENSIATLINMSFYNSRLTFDLFSLTVKSTKDAVKYIKKELLLQIGVLIDSTTSLEQLSSLQSVISTSCHFLQLRQIKLSSQLVIALDNSHFSKDTNSWKCLINKLKIKAIMLMKSTIENVKPLSQTPVASPKAIKFLERLMHENARTGLFDKLDEDYKREYDAFKGNFNSFILKGWRYAYGH